MKISLLLQTDSWFIALVLFLIMLLSIWLGVKTGQKRKKYFDATGIKETSSNTGYTSGLLFFLLAFTFSMSGSRYDSRRHVVVEEANNIGTALLRADLYPEAERLLFRNDFKEYVEARIAYYEAGADISKILIADSISQLISARLWERASRLSLNDSHTNATRQMIPALNDMIDITTTRMAGEKSKVPESIVWMLFAMAGISSFFSGYSATIKGRIDWLVEVGFCLLISIGIFFTLDLDRPRRGLITLDGPNETIIELRKNFK